MLICNFLDLGRIAHCADWVRTADIVGEHKKLIVHRTIEMLEWLLSDSYFLNSSSSRWRQGELSSWKAVYGRPFPQRKQREGAASEKQGGGNCHIVGVVCHLHGGVWGVIGLIRLGFRCKGWIHNFWVRGLLTLTPCVKVSQLGGDKPEHLDSLACCGK